MLCVDVHNHFAPRELIADARAGDGIDGLRIAPGPDGHEWVIHRQGLRWPLHPTFYDLQARLRAMDERGVDVAVLSVAPHLFMYWLDDVAAASECSRLTNDALAAFAAGSGGRIVPVATLPMRDPDAAARELRRAVTELGMKGAEIGPRVEEIGLDDPALRPVLGTAAELGVPLILHPYHVGKRPGLEDYYLSNLIGHPVETAVGAARLIFGGVLDELPDLQPVLMHGGGYLPYQIGRLDHGYRVRPESRGCRAEPSSYLRRFFYDTITHAAGPLRFLVEMVGPDRVVYGTDFPFDMAGGPVEEQLAGVGLHEEARRRIAGMNAVDLFRLQRVPRRTASGAAVP